MCGRYNFLSSPDELVTDYGLDEPVTLPPRYNVAPSQLVAVIGLHQNGTHRGLVMMRWGFVPRWAKSPNDGPKPINAKAESIGASPAFRDSFRERRCLIPATGFYEWRRDAKRKQPIHFRPTVKPIAFAGIWDVWKSPNMAPLYTCAIITTTANATVRPVHDRMPVILEKSQFAPWLDRTQPLDDVMKLVTAFPADRLEVFEVGDAVNSPKNDGPECWQPPTSARGTLFDDFAV